jgi:hypothetical protein
MVGVYVGYHATQVARRRRLRRELDPSARALPARIGWDIIESQHGAARRSRASPIRTRAPSGW